MPKMKTHSGASKRIAVTGSGKLRRRQENRSHLLEKKSATRRRRLGRPQDVPKGLVKSVRRMLAR
ncbi:MAG: 50S ribosomal protein L35 [Actinomycetota bacterium]